MHCVIPFPVGQLRIDTDGSAITGVKPTREPLLPPSHPLLEACARQLDLYFQGRLTAFTLPVRAEGTPFRRKVWQALCDIPYGQTRSYAQLAEMIGSPRAVRAVGGANHHNPVAIIIPCHRVIGADGSLTGYGGGLEMKAYLLALERKNTHA